MSTAAVSHEGSGAHDAVDILMATFNGATFIDLQIASILAQTHAPVRLLVRDDGSTDDTVARVRRWAAMDDRVVQLLDDRGRLGAARNFLVLLEASSASVVMFADQDDVWLSTKVERSLAVLGTCAASAKPTLLVSDALSFEEGRRTLIATTTQRARPTRLEDFLFLNGGFYGCCMALNRALVERVLACDVTYCAQHDHLISLVAIAFGRVVHLEEPLMFYRRHAANVSGGPVSAIERAKRFLLRRQPIVPESLWRAVDSFFRAERSHLNPRDRQTLERFLAFPRQSRLVSAWMICSHPFRIYGLRTILLAKLLFRPLS